MIRGVLFDLDGTLANTLDDLADAVNYVLRHLGAGEHPRENYKYFVGNGVAKLIERALPEDMRTAEIKAKALDRFFDYYGAHYLDKTDLYGGIEDMLCVLKRLKIKVAVITNKPELNAKAVCKKLIGDISVCGQTDGVPTKPAADMGIKVLKELNLSPSEVLYLGDSGSDMTFAKAVGMVPVGVLWGFRAKEELIESGAEYILSEPLELLELLNKLK